jgi:uncharacterized protein (DUF58 family)
MDTAELLRRVRRIEIKSRRLSNDIFAGEYHSAFKGKGMSFSEVREYQPGDDVRDIDWNVTARFNRPYVKVYEEERELTVMLLIDVSGSVDFGSRMRTKREIITEIAATLSFSAIENNDKIGVIFFSDHVEKYIPPQKGSRHILYIIRELLSFRPEGKGTDIAAALEFMLKIQRRQCAAFIISDFLDSHDLSDKLRIAGHKYDLGAIEVYDIRMKELPSVGIIELRDAETGHIQYVDTSSRRIRNLHAKAWQDHQQRLHQQFTRAGVRNVAIPTDGDYVRSLMQLFGERQASGR